jgi:trimeric autotransporter adhesin
MQKFNFKLILTCILAVSAIAANAQTPGGVSSGLRTWYRADIAASVPSATNGADVNLWKDQYNGDGAFQDAKQSSEFVISFFGNRQPQYRTAIARYNFHPYLDFTKRFSSLYAYRAHSNRPNYTWNYTEGSSLFGVGANNETLGGQLLAGLGMSATSNYEATVNWYPHMWTVTNYFYGWHSGTRQTFDFAKWKVKANIPYVNAVTSAKWLTVGAFGSSTGIQDRQDGEKNSWGYQFTVHGPSLTIGNEYQRYNAGRWWNGGIPEVVLYNRKVVEAQGGEYDRIDTYLATKYGTTLEHNYYNSAGAKVWDTLRCQTLKYNNEIAGLAKDAASALNQVLSHSVYPKSVVTMSVNTFSNIDNDANGGTITDLNSMYWGANVAGKALTRSSRPLPGGFAGISPAPAAGCLNNANVTWSSKRWRVQEQPGKDLGAVNVYIETKDVKCIDWTCSDAYIMVGSDENFTTRVYYPLVAAPGDGAGTSTTLWKATGVNFCVGSSIANTLCGTLPTQWFAIVGKANDCNPGGVTGGLVYWSRSDIGLHKDSITQEASEYATHDKNDRVIEWLNLAYLPNGRVPTTAIALSSQPQAIQPNRYTNFNPSVNFDEYGNNLQPIDNSFTNNTANPQFGAEGILNNNTLNVGGIEDSLTLFGVSQMSDNWFNPIIGVGDAPYYPALTNDNGVTSAFVNSAALQATCVAPKPPGYAQPDINGAFVSATNISYTLVSSGYWYPVTSAPTAVNINGNVKTWSNGDSTGNFNTYTGIVTRTVAGRTNLGIGAGITGGVGGSRLMEAIAFTRKLSGDERFKVESFLGIHNGVTIRHNYYSSLNTLIHDSTLVDALPDTTGGSMGNRYTWSTTGIGRDDASCLEQRVSRNTVDTTLTISLENLPDDESNEGVNEDFASNNSFVIWGSNGASQNIRITTDLPTTLPGCIDSRVKREYLAQITTNGAVGGALGTNEMTVRWELDNNILETRKASVVSLLLDDDGDGDFTTGTVRVVAAKSYDPVRNAAIFEKVQLDPDGNGKVAYTLGWGENSVGVPILYNGTNPGGGNCINGNCPGNEETQIQLCTDAAGWTYYEDAQNTMGDNFVTVAINWGVNNAAKASAVVKLDVNSTIAQRTKYSLTATLDSGAIIGARMLNVSNTGTLTGPVKVRFYIDSNEIKNDFKGRLKDTAILDEPIVTDSSLSWFKFEGDFAATLAALTVNGLPKGDPGTAGTAFYLTPDETGVENGIQYVQFNNIAEFSTFGWVGTYSEIEDPVVLPQGLLSFDAALRGTTANLYWQHSGDEQLRFYDVERSTNNRDFSRISTVNTNGLSGAKTYETTDDVSSLTGVVYYRLRLVGRDGSVAYSPVRIIRIGRGGKALQVLPNPFKDNFTAVINSFANEQVSIRILSLNGAVVKAESRKLAGGDVYVQLDGSQLSAGTYILEVRHEDGTLEKAKLVKAGK